jgi:general secretion pathway protein A
MEMERFVTHWSGAFLYLWQLPAKIRSLRWGDINPEALSWLQNKLQQADDGYEQIITGGRYNAAIRERVLLFQKQQGIKADGVVGRQTIMKLNQLANPSTPRLVNKEIAEGAN